MHRELEPAGSGRQQAGHPGQPLVLLLVAARTSPRTARAAIRDALAGWGLGDLADAAELVVSELVTNAIQALSACSAPAPICLCACRFGQGVRIAVWDGDAREPVMRDTGPGDESGRGLPLVDALTGGKWGWKPVPLGGKTVWAEIA